MDINNNSITIENNNDDWISDCPFIIYKVLSIKEFVKDQDHF